MDEPVSIFLIAEDPIVRGVWADRLRGAGARVVGEASAWAEARDARPDGPIDVTLWDLGVHPEAALDQASGADAAADLLVIVPDAGAAAEALGLGAKGVIGRQTSTAELAAAVRAVAAGLLVVSPSVRPDTLGATRRAAAAESLTARESEVLALLVEGLSNKLIAARLGISEHTAKFHVNAVMQKVGAQTRTEAVVRAARLGLVTL